MPNKTNKKELEDLVSNLSKENEVLKDKSKDNGKEWKQCSIHKTLFNNLNDCIAIYKATNNGKDFIIYDLNEAAEKTDRVKRDEIIGKNILDVFKGVKEFGLLEVLERVWKTGISEHHPLKFYKDERISGWRQNYVFKIPKEDLVVSVYEDVTERENIKNDFISLSKFPEEDPYPVLRISSDLTLLYANPGSKILLSYWKIGKGDKIPNTSAVNDEEKKGKKTELSDCIRVALEKGKHSLIEVDCDDIIYSLVVAPVKEGNYVNIYGRDITFRKKIESALYRANRMFKLISQINQTIIRVDSEEELFKKICKNTIEFGKFDFAWIGKVDYIQNCIIPLEYKSGEEGEFLSQLRIPLDENNIEGQGPAPRAVREKMVIVSNNISEDPSKNLIKDNILTRKYHSAAAVPFYIDDKVYGILGVLTHERGFFDTDEIKLLEEISMDISFALKEIRIRAEAKMLREAEIENEKTQRKILEEMPVAAVSCDSMGKIQFVNKKMLEMLGSPSEESTKQINLLNFPPLDAIGFSEAIRESISSRTKVVIESYYTSKWGKKSYYQCHFLPLENEKNIITYVLIMAIDLTELKKVENILKESEERFRTITEAAPYPVSIFDSSYNYIYLNPKFTELFGYTIEDIPSREKWFELAYPNPEYRIYVQKEWGDTINSNYPDTLKTFYVTCKNGSVRNVVFSAHPIDNGRTLLYYLDLSEIPR